MAAVWFWWELFGDDEGELGGVLDAGGVAVRGDGDGVGAGWGVAGVEAAATGEGEGGGGDEESEQQVGGFVAFFYLRVVMRGAARWEEGERVGRGRMASCRSWRCAGW